MLPVILVPGAEGSTLVTTDGRPIMTAAAARLDALIDRLRRVRREPGLRVDLGAHSAGGLVIRYFIRFGACDVLDQPLGEAPPSFAGTRPWLASPLSAVAS
jgi:hypothetical protein